MFVLLNKKKMKTYNIHTNLYLVFFLLMKKRNKQKLLILINSNIYYMMISNMCFFLKVFLMTQLKDIFIFCYLFKFLLVYIFYLLDLVILAIIIITHKNLIVNVIL
jgi:hypothetical protein